MKIQAAGQLQELTPILNVSNFRASMNYYTKKLGFKKVWEWGRPADFGCVVRDGITVFFCHSGQGKPGMWLYVTVRDVDALHRELRKRGAKIVCAPTDRPWGMRECLVEDPDGHTIRFGQSRVPEDLPIQRVKVEARLEKRLAAVLGDLARRTNRTVGEVLEETLLHSFEPVPGQKGQAVASPHAKRTFELIDSLKKKHRLDYDTHANYRFKEK